MTYDIYWNTRKGMFSVRQSGKVVAHTSGAVIYNPQFVVSEAGRLRVVKTKQKNVHAFIRGDVVLKKGEKYGSSKTQFNTENRAYSDFSYAVYDPYDECGCFRVKCVIGEFFVKGDFAKCIKMVHAYVYDGGPVIKVKMS